MEEEDKELGLALEKRNQNIKYKDEYEKKFTEKWKELQTQLEADKQKDKNEIEKRIQVYIQKSDEHEKRQNLIKQEMRLKLKETLTKITEFQTKIQSIEHKRQKILSKDNENRGEVAEMLLDLLSQVQTEIRRRNLIKEKEYQNRVDTLKCTLCCERERNRIILTCGHTTCDICLDKILKLNNQCPYCKVEINGHNPMYLT